MSLTTYPLDAIDYTADDAALYHATRSTGVHAGDDFTFSVTGADNQVTLGPGIAWMHLNRFRSIVTALRTEYTVDLGIADSSHPRIDHVVIQYSANKNAADVVVKQGAAAASPQPPERSTTESLYEIHLLQVYREPGAVSITAANLRDLRLDRRYCGLMADASVEIDTSGIHAQIQAFMDQLERELAMVEAGTASELKKLHFENTVVPASAFVADATWEADGFGYRAAVPLAGVIGSMVPEVVFGVKDAMSGSYAPVAGTYSGGVYIYAASVPKTNITIPTILCWRGGA